MAVKLPALQWYPGDWRKDPGIQALSYEERGVWFELLMLMHDCDDRGKLILNGNPITNHRLGIMLRLTEDEISQHISQFISLGVASVCETTGAVMCRRMVRDEDKRKKLSGYGRLGGNPEFEKGKSNPYHKPTDKPLDKPTDKPNITPSSSSSSSSSEESVVPTSGTHKPRNRFVPPTAEEVRAYCKEIGFELDAEKFVAHYNASGWKRGKQQTPITNWKGCVQTWRTNERSTPVPTQPYFPELKELPDEPAPKNTKPVEFTMEQFDAEIKRLANK